MKRAGAIAFAIVSLLLLHPGATRAWDNRTHREITELAIDRLPPSPLKDYFLANDERLRRLSVEPDSILKHRYGKAEQIRHYINIEYFGSDPFAAIVADRQAMERKFGASTMQHAGTLPWTIEEVADAMRQAWARGDCEQVLQQAGYLAHYVGDASQPLHSTILFDGYRRDRGMHARMELAVDDRIDEIGAAASRETKPLAIDSVWPPVIAQIREANSHVEELIQADRAARNGGSRKDYDESFLGRDKALIVSEIASAASLLASIWLFEWQQSGTPAKCSSH